MKSSGVSAERIECRTSLRAIVPSSTKTSLEFEESDPETRRLIDLEFLILVVTSGCRGFAFGCSYP